MMTYCTHCGAKLVEDSHFCVSCGHPVEDIPVEEDSAEDVTEPAVSGTATGSDTDTDTEASETSPPAESAASSRSGGRRALVVALIVVLVGLAGVAAWKLWPSGSEPPPSAGPSAPTQPSVAIGPVTVSDVDGPDTVFEFSADAVVPEPPKTLRCQVSHTTTVFTAAGAMAEETEAGVDFTLTVATRALELMEGLFPEPGVQVTCSVAGAVATETIDRKTGEIITLSASPSPTSSKLPAADPPDAPAVQINVEALNVSPKSSNVDFVVTVEGGTSGGTLKCVVTNIEPRDLAEDSVQLAGGVEEHRFEFDLSDKYELLAKSGWLLFRCDAESGTAYETIARPRS